MTIVLFPAKEEEPAKTLKDFPWDENLGKPHGVVGDNGINEPHRDINEATITMRPPEFPPDRNDLVQRADKINPSHYKKGDTEVIDLTEKLGFCEGNIVKYVCRYKDKGGKDDLLKAKWYLERLIARYEPGDAPGYHGC